MDKWAEERPVVDTDTLDWVKHLIHTAAEDSTAVERIMESLDRAKFDAMQSLYLALAAYCALPENSGGNPGSLKHRFEILYGEAKRQVADEEDEPLVPLRPKQEHITMYVGKSYGEE